MHTLSLPSHLYYLIKVFPAASARIVVKCMSMKNTSCKKHRFEIVILEVCDLGNMEVAVSPLSKWWIQLGDQSSETTRGNLSSHVQPRTLRCQKDAEVTGAQRAEHSDLEARWFSQVSWPGGSVAQAWAQPQTWKPSLQWDLWIHRADSFSVDWP